MTFFSKRCLPAGDPGLKSFPYAYGLMHAIVDASTITVIFCSIAVHELPPREATVLIFGYDFLAFAGQAFWGALADRLRYSRAVVIAGIVLTMAAVLLLNVEPLAAAIAAGTGNALFHVGAGALSLFVRPGRATAPGIFVGPGALGLGLGLWLGKSGDVVIWPFMVALALSLVFAAVSDNPKISYERNKHLKGFKLFWPILLLLLLSITIRSFVGHSGSYLLPKDTTVSFALAFAAFAGKASGGIISDRLGWIKTSVGALLLSAPLIAFGGANPFLIVGGMFLFQMTMPVTLVAIAEIMPGKPAFAFGLACLVLVTGSFISFYTPFRVYYSGPLFMGLCVLSAGAIFLGLTLMKDKIRMRFTDSNGSKEPSKL